MRRGCLLLVRWLIRLGSSWFYKSYLLSRSLVAGSARLTGATVNYSVVNVNNRDSRLISKKISLRSPFPFIGWLYDICLYSMLLCTLEIG